MIYIYKSRGNKISESLFIENLDTLMLDFFYLRGKLLIETSVLNNNFNLDQVINMGSTREHILKSAVELFGEKGFDNTTIRDICKHADANIAAVNYHFKGKIGLGEAVIELLFENTPE